MRPIKSIAERFWKRVRIDPSGCWLWTGACTTAGYGTINSGGPGPTMTLLVHRLIWEWWWGDIPAGLCICHRCDRQNCVRPSHLCLGTQRGQRRQQPSLQTRFWSKVKMEPGGCWLWTGAHNGVGYGQISAGPGRKGLLLAHRLIWTWLFGDIPDGMYICHRCDVPSCVRPSHLFMGTSKENHEDCISKGRHNIGDRNGQTKLTAEQVNEIRSRVRRGESQTSLAQEFGVSSGNVGHIARNDTWKHLPYSPLENRSSDSSRRHPGGLT